MSAKCNVCKEELALNLEQKCVYCHTCKKVITDMSEVDKNNVHLKIDDGYPGYLSYCPHCKTVVPTDRCACMCGSCMFCGYRWCCTPVEFPTFPTNTTFYNLIPNTKQLEVYLQGEHIGKWYVNIDDSKACIAKDIFEGMPYPGIYRVNWEDCEKNENH